MKGIVFSLILWTYGSMASASNLDHEIQQGLKPETVPPAFGWAIDTGASKTTITKPNISTKRWFAIANTSYLSQSNVVKLQVDNEVFPFPLHPGGQALVYGAQVLISHSSAQQPSVGLWAIVPLSEVPTTSVIWTVSPAKGPLATIAKFDVEREFIIDVTKELPPPEKSCRHGKLKVLVDGRELNSEGGVAAQDQDVYSQGSALIGKGKVIAIHAIGECEGSAYFSGTLRFLDFLAQ